MSFLPPEPMFFGYELDDHHHPHHFQGVEAVMMRRSMSYSGRELGCEEVHAGGEGETSDDEGCQLGEKKRRLNLEQVKALEKSFELGNKLEPERKRQLARALGLQPRQVAIWFQNRRARWKTKQLEKDYNVLKRQFDSIKADNDALKNQNNKLHAQLMALKSGDPNANGVRAMVNLNKETEGSWSNGSDNSCEDNSNIFYTHIPNHLTTTSSMIRGLTPPYLLGQPLNQTVAGDHEGFCNMLNVMEDQQPAFWPWPEAEQEQQPPQHLP